MHYTIADRIQGVQGSIIRESFKLAKDPNIITFGGGNPSPEAFPVADIARITADILAENPASVLQYGLSEGYTPLRETVQQHLQKTENISFEDNELFIVSGGQQGADLTTKVLVNEGDVILTEDPAFVGCLNTFRTYGTKLVGIPMESDGMNIEALEHALKTHKNIRLLYTIPSFQNPTGFTTSAEKRRQIYALACQYNIMILEDNPYGELRFSGTPIPTIKSMDTENRVIYIGSFSKVMAPAFRLGMIVFPSALSSRMTVAKQCTDVHSNVLFQHICYMYMTTCDYEGHIAYIRALYKKKANRMLDAMEQHFHPDIRFNRPDGGLFVMSFLPDGMDAHPFVKEGILQGVACVPGIAFAVDQSKPNNGFRMNYSMPSEEQIDRGIALIGKLTHQWMQK